MKRWPAYVKYKPSGIDWLGDIPEHWRNIKVKWYSRRYTGGTPDKSNDAFWEDGTIPWLNSGAVNDLRITDPSAYITQDAYVNSSTKWVPKGALLIALAGQGKTKGMVARLMFRATCNQSMAAIISDSRLNSDYLFWWLTKNYTNIRNLGGGDSRDGINLEMLGGIVAPFPPIVEQDAIAAFLDRETGEIDDLIQKREKLIALLQEKRSALISHAVTKGLDPKVKLKSSGIDWLGDIPENWKLLRLKYNVSINDEVLPETTSADFDFDYIDIGSVIKDHGIIEKQHFSFDAAPSRARRCVKCGDTIVSTVRTYLRAIATISANDENDIVSTGFAVLRPRTLYAKFLSYFCKNSFFIENVVSRSVGVSYPAINALEIGNIFLVIPPIEEQQAIAEYLDRETGKIDSLIEKENQLIEKMKEYRTALISAAVTGKIDVRGGK